MKKLWRGVRVPIMWLLLILMVMSYIPVKVEGQDVNEWLGYFVFRQASPQLRYDGVLSFRRKDGTTVLGNVGQTGVQRIAAGQPTAPACENASSQAACTVQAGSDFAFRGTINNPPNWSDEIRITFNTAYASAPICLAEAKTAYYYYLDSVTATATGVTLRLGAKVGQANAGGTAGGGWSPGDEFSVICAGAGAV